MPSVVLEVGAALPWLSQCICDALPTPVAVNLAAVHAPAGSTPQAPAPTGVARPPRAQARVARRAEDAGRRGSDPAGAAAGGRGRAAGVRGAGRGRGRGAAGAATPAAPAATGAGDPAPVPVLSGHFRLRCGPAGSKSSARTRPPMHRRARRSWHRRAQASESVRSVLREAGRPRRVQAGYVWRPGMPAPGALAAASPGGYVARPAYGGQPYAQQPYGAQLRPVAPAPRALTEDERRVLPQKARPQRAPDAPLACNNRLAIGYHLWAFVCERVMSGARRAALHVRGDRVCAGVLGLPARPCDAHTLAFMHGSAV